MKELSKIIYAALLAAKLPGVLKKIFPVVANAGANMPIVIYKLTQTEIETKDRARNYKLVVSVYHQSYDRALDLLDRIETTMASVSYQEKAYKFTLSSQDVNFSKNDEVFVGTINFNIKK